MIELRGSSVLVIVAQDNLGLRSPLLPPSSRPWAIDGGDGIPDTCFPPELAGTSFVSHAAWSFTILVVSLLGSNGSKKCIGGGNDKERHILTNIVKKEKASLIFVWLKTFLFWHLTFDFYHFWHPSYVREWQNSILTKELWCIHQESFHSPKFSV